MGCTDPRKPGYMLDACVCGLLNCQMCGPSARRSLLCKTHGILSVCAQPNFRTVLTVEECQEIIREHEEHAKEILQVEYQKERERILALEEKARQEAWCAARLQKVGNEIVQICGCLIR